MQPKRRDLSKEEVAIVLQTFGRAIEVAKGSNEESPWDNLTEGEGTGCGKQQAPAVLQPSGAAINVDRRCSLCFHPLREPHQSGNSFLAWFDCNCDGGKGDCSQHLHCCIWDRASYEERCLVWLLEHGQNVVHISRWTCPFCGMMVRGIRLKRSL